GKTTALLWRFTKTGTFEYSCLIPDHRDYGMTGHVSVK
ncbi:MAG: plastocyanin/azurin family copper-binding protein, partial [Bradyrhizobium sp.]